MATFLLIPLCGCSGFWSAPTQPTPTTEFSTITQVYDDPINMNKLPFIPRPHQPLLGQMQSVGTNAIGTVKSFGSSFGAAYTTYTDKNGQLIENSLEVNSPWDLYYNWLPIGGCVSQNPAWNGNSAPNTEYITDPNNPVLLTSTETGSTWSNVTVPPIACNQLVTELQTITPQVVTSAPPSSMTIAFGKDPSLVTVPPGPLTGYSPSSLTLYVYDQSGTQVTTASTTSVSTDGYSATFTFPKTSQGALANGMYGTTIVANASSAFPTNLGGEGYFFIGSINSSYVAPFGVAAANFHEMDEVCPAGTRQHSDCTTTTWTDYYPLVTEVNSGKLIGDGKTVTVGSLPVAVVAYGAFRYSNVTSTESLSENGTGTALVVNAGSNNVSFVDLRTLTVAATTPVGQKPVAAVVDSANTYAYVANYASNSVSQISLSTYAVTGTIAVGANPSALALDAAGNLWVGGNGYIQEYNVTTHALMSSSASAGQVNSLAVSAKQNRVISTAVKSGVAALAQVSYSSTPAPSAITSSSAQYTSSTMASILPNPYLLAGGTTVSVNYGNNLSISATPTGYVVQDVYTGAVLLSGTTPAPVRGIAVDQTNGFAYLTVPDTNSVYTVPIP
jgi:YVTN family beta-propeller protein